MCRADLLPPGLEKRSDQGRKKITFSIPVIGVSCIREPQVAESFLEGGIVDFVSMGRSWLADEQWGLKVLEGREK